MMDHAAAIGIQQGGVEWMVSQEAEMASGISCDLSGFWSSGKHFSVCFPAMFDGLYLHTIINKQNIFSLLSGAYGNANWQHSLLERELAFDNMPTFNKFSFIQLIKIV
jgi:hypothetical protein